MLDKARYPHRASLSPNGLASVNPQLFFSSRQWSSRIFILAALVVVLGSLALASGARAAEGDVSYLVTFTDGTSPAEQDAAINAAGATDVSSVGALRLHNVTASTEAVDLLR